MKIFRTLREKPWLPQQDGVDFDMNQAAAATSAVFPVSAERIALRFFMAVIGVIFFLIIIALLERSQYPDFQALAGLPWAPFTNPWRLWLNTVVLLVSSIALYICLLALRTKQDKLAISLFALAAALAILFLTAQLMLWQQLTGHGYTAAANPANSFFYLLTGVHGVHIGGGLLVMAKVALQIWRRGGVEELAGSVRLLLNYWHLLFAIWLVIFAVMASSQETIRAIATICGFSA